MELVFQEKRLEYLSCILSERLSQEQTADLVLPDRYPDVQRVVRAGGTLLLGNRECSGGSAAVTGSVRAEILYAGPEGELRRVQAQIPFSLRRDWEKPDGEVYMQCSCSLCSVDARILNSRKILVRVAVQCELKVYEPRNFVSYTIPEPAPNLQLRQRELPMELPLGIGEKSFAVNEELELPSDAPEGAQLLQFRCRTAVQEQKMVGSKGVFKGSLLVDALFEGEDGVLFGHHWNLPFSQYAELEKDLEDCSLQTELSLCSVEAEADSQPGSQRLLLSANLLAQCCAGGIRRIWLIEDAFCTDGELEPKWQEDRISAVLDRQLFQETAVLQETLEIKELVDVWADMAEPVWQREQERMELCLPLSFSVLYRDREDQMQGECFRSRVCVETQLAENGQCSLYSPELGEIFSTVAGDTLAIRMPLRLYVQSSAQQLLRRVSGAQVLPLQEEGEQRPSVILRFTDGKEELWQIAKSCRSSVEAIMAANELDGEEVPENSLLLIPL